MSQNSQQVRTVLEQQFQQNVDDKNCFINRFTHFSYGKVPTAAEIAAATAVFTATVTNGNNNNFMINK